DRGCLAGSVRTNEAEDIPLLEPQRKILHGRQVSIILTQVLDVNHEPLLYRRCTRNRLTFCSRAARPFTLIFVRGCVTQPMSMGWFVPRAVGLKFTIGCRMARFIRSTGVAP